MLGGVFGAFAFGSMTRRILDEQEGEEEALEDTLRFLARIHATLQMVDRLVVDMYEDSIIEGEIEIPSTEATDKIRRRVRRLWSDDAMADHVGQAILRNLDVEFH